MLTPEIAYTRTNPARSGLGKDPLFPRYSPYRLARYKQSMKAIWLVILMFFSVTLYSQDSDVIIQSVDTIELRDFHEKKVVLYEFENAKICIKAQDYLDGIKVFHDRYRKWADESNKGTPGYKWTLKNYEVIKTVFESVQNGILFSDTVIVSFKEFEETQMSGLIDFDKFIDSSKCAIFDENGIRVFKLIKKKVLFNFGPDDIFGGGREILLNKSKETLPRGTRLDYLE